MSDLIDCKELLKAFAERHIRTASDAVILIKDAPRVDAEPVRYGYWKSAQGYPFYHTCSECENCYIDEAWTYNGKWNYCPNCGAKMDEEVGK